MDKLRYLNKETNLNERQNFSLWWREQINIYGQEVQYYTNNTTISSSNVLYGEDTSAGFDDAKSLIVLLNLNNDSIILSKWGLIADSDMSGVIHYDDYTTVFGLSSEPKEGDLMCLREYGIDRLNYPKRGPTIYQLTEVIDEFQGNPLGGHYVWFFKAKRYDFSFESNSPGHGMGNTPLDDNDKIEEVSQQNFNYIVDNPCSNTSVYGDYSS